MITTQWDEVWLPVAGYEGLYKVSDQGRVMSIFPRWGDTPIILKPILRGVRYRYYSVTLYKAGRGSIRRVHQLVAEAFYPDHDPAHEVNHKDGVKTNNRAINLEWVSKSQNAVHALSTGLHIPRGSKLTPDDVRDIRYAAAHGVRQDVIAAVYGMNRNGVARAVQRKTWKHVD